jgi:hypothetical protein
MGKIKGQDKGANGRIAEYACAHFLAQALKQANQRVVSDMDLLQNLLQEEIQKYNKSLTQQQINIAVEAGQAMGDSMLHSILNRGQDLVFVDYDFFAHEHTFDIQPTGSAQNKGTTDDMVICIQRDKNTPAQKILLSLKVSASSSNSQGSKGPLPLLYKMFVDPKARKVKTQEFLKHFGNPAQQFVDIMQDFRAAGREFLASSEGQLWAKDKQAERIARGKDPKKSQVKADTNFFRSKEVGEYYTKTRKQVSSHCLGQLFVQLYNQGKNRMNQNDWEKFNQGFAQAIGFDEVITYKAICDESGVKQVVSSATSKAYQQMYRVLNKKIDVMLESKPNSSGIAVKVKCDNTVLDSLTCSIWKDGTIQFKFDSDRESDESEDQ